jgi:hypothetical protein
MERASAQRLVVSEQVDGSDNPRKVRPQPQYCRLVISDGTSPQDTSPLVAFTCSIRWCRVRLGRGCRYHARFDEGRCGSAAWGQCDGSGELSLIYVI